MPTPDELRDWDRHHHWHAFTQMAEYEPLVVERADGCWLFDTGGNRYLDGASSMWCTVLGHHHPRIDAAVREQLDRVAHCTSLGMGGAASAHLAKRLSDLAPGELQHVFFSSDGASAVEVALKAAFQYWLQCDTPQPAKKRYIALGEAYHGDTLGAAAVGGIARFHALFRPLLFDVVRAPVPDPRRLPPDTPPETATRSFLAELEPFLAEHHEELAALVIEPLVQCAAGMVMHPPGYLRGVRELTRRYNVLMIADEIAVGFGRTGTMFACEQEDVVPDFLCLGKGLSGGYLPVSATITHPGIYNAFLGDAASGRTLYHGHTFGGNSLGAAAALATLDVFRDDEILAQLLPKIERLREHLARLAEHPHVAFTRQRGLVGALELTADKSTGAPYPADQRTAWQVCRAALRRGLWIRPLGEVLYALPPLTVSLDELDFLMNTLQASIDEVTKE